NTRRGQVGTPLAPSDTTVPDGPARTASQNTRHLRALPNQPNPGERTAQTNDSWCCRNSEADGSWDRSMAVRYCCRRKGLAWQSPVQCHTIAAVFVDRRQLMITSRSASLHEP